MNYVKHFNLFGTEARQITCLELEGVPTSSTEGEVGVLGIDVTSKTLDLYKCTSAKDGVYAWEKVSGDLIQTVSSNTDINDINVNDGELKGIKEVNFYGNSTQESGATLSSPKKITLPDNINTISCCNQIKWGFNGTIDYPLIAVNNYKDSGWVDLKNNKIHYKRFIKKIVLDGTETYTIGDKTHSAWSKASSPKGRYFVNLHQIDGLLTEEDLNRLSNGDSIAYDDAMCTIGNKYFTGAPFSESGQFGISQGISSSSGVFFRFQFFAPEFSTLDEVLAQVKKNPITLLIPMIYEVYEEELDCTSFSTMIKKYGKNPFSLYVYDYRGGQYATTVTYKVDVGLSLSNMKDAIISLGGNV